MNISLQNWLDSKVSDSTIKDKYEVNDYNLPPHSNSSSRYKNIHTFQKYYDGIDDQDVEASDSFYTGLLETMRDTNPKDIRKDPQLKFLDSINEVYKQDDHKLSVLIPPNSNRHHTNYLFKQLVDCSDYNNMNYVISDSKNTQDIPYIDVNIKDAFYKFCQDNTLKTI